MQAASPIEVGSPTDAKRSATADRLRLVVAAGLILLAAAAPFPFGSVQPGWTAALEIGIAVVALLWLAVQFFDRTVRIVRTPIALPLALLAVYLLATLVPLGSEIARLVSPEGQALYAAVADTAAKSGVEVAVRPRLTLAPFATSGELIRFVATTLYFLLALDAFRRPETFRAARIAVVGLGTAVALFGLVQSIWSNGKIYWLVDPAAGTPFGPFVNHNHFAGYLELALGVAFGMLFAAVAHYRKARLYTGTEGYLVWLTDAKAARPWRLVLCVVVMLVAVAASLSRGGMLSLVGAGVLFALTAVLGARAGRAPARLKVVAGLAAVALVLFGVLAFAPSVRTRWASVLDESARYRIGIWKDSEQAFSDFPAVGAGLGSFRSLYPRYKKRMFHSESTHAENEYLQWLLETGLVGTLLLAWVGGAYAQSIGQRLAKRRDPYYKSLAGGALFGLVALSLHNFFDFNLHIPSNALQFALVAALALSAANLHTGDRGERSLLETTRLRLASPAGAASAAAVFALAAALGLGAWTHYQSVKLEAAWSREARGADAGRAPGGFEPLDRALAWSETNDRAHFARALALERTAARLGPFQAIEKRRQLELAQDAALRALALRPLQGTYWGALGRIEAGLRRPELSDVAFRQALRLGGSIGGLHRDYGLALLGRNEVRAGVARLVAARNYAVNLDLRELLEAVAAVSRDPRVWQTLVRFEPADLRVYADFLADHGHAALAEQFRRQAEQLAQELGRGQRR